MKALVTGGGGFIGKRIVELLIEQGHEVSFLARGHYPDVEALGATGLRADLVDADAISKAVSGCDVVFHVAARFGFGHDRDAFWSVNVTGTDNVIEACVSKDVPRLIYTSTPSVVGYVGDQEGIAEAPYATAHEGLYGETKAEAEQRVLAANGRGLASGGQLATISLRPHLVFGPGDPKLIPTAVERARAGRLPIVGDGTNRVDLTFIDNAAWSHLDAASALTGADVDCAGRAYFISNDEPVHLWDWFNEVLPQVGAAKITRKISLNTASRVGWVMECAWKYLPLPGEPRMTRFMAAALARSHWYDMGPAKRDFGYFIRVDMDEATRRTVDWFNR
jgi:nucleoside-diphosphate-sugar epimerase